MGIEFDPAKDVLNIKNHGLSLAVAAELEWDLLISHEDDTLHDYYEQRMVGFAAVLCGVCRARGRPDSHHQLACSRKI